MIVDEQDGYFEEALKLRNLLEFDEPMLAQSEVRARQRERRRRGCRQRPSRDTRRISLIGFPEHIFSMAGFATSIYPRCRSATGTLPARAGVAARHPPALRPSRPRRQAAFHDARRHLEGVRRSTSRDALAGYSDAARRPVGVQGVPPVGKGRRQLRRDQRLFAKPRRAPRTNSSRATCTACRACSRSSGGVVLFPHLFYVSNALRCTSCTSRASCTRCSA